MEPTQTGQPKPRAWVWASTPTSFANHSISVLAVAETIAAMLVYAHIAIHYGTLHLTLAAFIAPFLLLRTDESVLFALTHSKSFRENELAQPNALPKTTRQSLICLVLLAVAAMLLAPLFSSGREKFSEYYIATSMGALLLFWFTGTIALFVFVLMPLLMRVTATLHGLYIDPKHAVTNIPSNWWQQVACLDSLHPPEILPGSINYEAARRRVSELQPYGYFLSRIIIAFQSEDTALRKLKSLAIAAGNVMAYMTAAVPTYIFRFSIKGTSLLLLPLVWLVHDARETKPDHFVKSSLVKGTFKASCFVVLIFFGSICLSVLGTDFSLSEHLTKLQALRETSSTVKAFFPRDAVPPWQVATLVLACLSIATYLFAERLSIRGSTLGEHRVFQSLLGGIGLVAVGLVFILITTSAAEALRAQGAGA